MTVHNYDVAGVDYEPMEDGRWYDCLTCWGSGEFVYCIDDLCYGQDECIHGDPPGPCRDCKGEGGHLVPYSADEKWGPSR